MLDAKLLVLISLLVAPPLQTDDIALACRIFALILEVLRAAVAWMAILAIKEDGAAYAREAVLIGTWIKHLALQFLDKKIPLFISFLSLSALADMSLLSRRFPADMHRDNQVRIG